MILGEQQAGVDAVSAPVMGAAAGSAVEEINPSGAGDVLLVCEHASSFIPLELNHLGLPENLRASHIAWDPGALPVALALSAILDAPLIAQRVSRLVYDCNRPPDAEDAVPAISEVHSVPGNTGLTESARQNRVARYYQPFRTALDVSIARRIADGRPPVIVTIHSFTPVYRGISRDVEIGVLHDSDTRLADAVLRSASTQTRFDVRRNAPYGPEDGVTHTLREHAVARGLLNVMIEIRNDLIAEARTQADVAQWLCRHIGDALASFALSEPQAGSLGDTISKGGA